MRFPARVAAVQPDPIRQDGRGQRLTRRARSARRGRGGRWPVAFGATGGRRAPRRVAKARAFAKHDDTGAQRVRALQGIGEG